MSIQEQAIKRAYLRILSAGVRFGRDQELLLLLRDSISEIDGRDSRDVQEDYEHAALMVRHERRGWYPIEEAMNRLNARARGEEDMAT